MKIYSSDTGLSLFMSDQEAYFFDRSGRAWAGWEEGWFLTHGLGGRSVARRWRQGRREVRALTPEDQRRIAERTRVVLEAASSESVTTDTRAALARCIRHARATDAALFHSVYQPVGILPPDQYGACVVQVTEGCGWNHCHFCSFYRAQRFRIRSLDEIREHIRKIGDFFGEGLSLRRSIFLGEASALAAPVEIVRAAMEAARAHLVPRMPHFRGFYAFLEPAESACRREADFRQLREAGLRRAYIGLETGDPDLRKRLGKPGALEGIAEAVKRVKSAGVRVALILLVGAGGRRWEKRHLEGSLSFLGQLALDAADIVYLSPLHGPDGTAESPLKETELSTQLAIFRHALAPKVRVAPYDIREFVY